MAPSFQNIPREIRDQIYEDTIDVSGQQAIHHRAWDHSANPLQCRFTVSTRIAKAHSMLIVNKKLSSEYLEAIARYSVHDVLISRSLTRGDTFALKYPKPIAVPFKRVTVSINTWCDYPDPWKLNFQDDDDLPDWVMASVFAEYAVGEKEDILDRLSKILLHFSHVEDLTVNWEGKDWEPCMELRQISEAAQRLPRIKSCTVISERKDKLILVRVEMVRKTVHDRWTGTRSQKYTEHYHDDEQLHVVDEVIAGMDSVKLLGDEDDYASMFYGDLVQRQSEDISVRD